MFCFAIASMIKKEYILCEKSLILKNCYKIVIEWACNDSNYSRWWCRQHDPQATGVISWVGNSKLHMSTVWVLSLPETALLELFISRGALLKDMGTNINYFSCNDCCRKSVTPPNMGNDRIDFRDILSTTYWHIKDEHAF